METILYLDLIQTQNLNVFCNVLQLMGVNFTLSLIMRTLKNVSFSLHVKELTIVIKCV